MRLPELRRLARFWRFSRRDQALLVEAAWLQMVARAGLFLLQLKTLQRLLARLIFAHSLQRQPFSPWKVAHAIDATGKYLPGKNCLIRALVGEVLLRREGYPAMLKIGVAKEEKRDLRAHAWVELEGRVVIGFSSKRQYMPLTAQESQLT